MLKRTVYLLSIFLMLIFITGCNEEKKNYDDVLKNLESRISVLEEDNKKLDDKLSDYNSKLSSIDNITSEIETLADKIDDLKSQKNTNNSEDIDKKIANYEKQITQYKKELNEIKNEIREENNEIAPEILYIVYKNDSMFVAKTQYNKDLRRNDVMVENAQDYVKVPDEYNLTIDDKYAFDYYVYPYSARGNRDIVWSSSNPEIATVDSGIVKALKLGTTKICIKYKKNEHCINLNVTKETLSISADHKIAIGEYVSDNEYTIVSSNKSSTYNDYKLTSSNSNVIKITNDGKIVGVAPGKAKITVTGKDGATITDEFEVINSVVRLFATERMIVGNEYNGDFAYAYSNDLSSYYAIDLSDNDTLVISDPSAFEVKKDYNYSVIPLKTGEFKFSITHNGKNYSQIVIVEE